jgi:SAM-dependent methyltransferase
VAEHADTNRRFYDTLWREARLQQPERFNTWPIVQRLVAGRPALELGPGLRPRLPLSSTVFVDASRPAARSLRERGARALAADVTRLPFRASSFAVVAAFDIIEHVADDRAVFDEITRVLTPEGYLLLSVPLHQSAWTEFDAFVGHHRRYDPPELERALTERDLRVVESAVYGMQPHNRRLLEFGVWMLRHQRARAMWWYNAYTPFAIWLQKPLQFVPGLVDLPGVDEIIAVCRRGAGIHSSG